MMLQKFLQFALCVTLVYCLDKPNIHASEAIFSSERVIMEEGHTIETPDSWTRIGAAPSSHIHRLIFAVKQQNTDKLEQIFWQVSDPAHPNYGNHLTVDDITELVAPKPEHLSAVQQWIEEMGIPKENQQVARNKDFITIYAPISIIEKMVQAQFSVFVRTSTHSKEHVTSLGPYYLPKKIAHFVDFVSGVSGFPLEKKSLTGAEASPPGTSMIGPSDLRKRYNVTTFGTNPKNKQAVAEFQDQFYSPSDLASFFRQYVSYHKAETVTKVVGSNDGSDPGVEASLDIQYIMGVAAGVPTWFWSNPAYDFWSDLTSWTTQISDTADAPWVQSVSYGSQGSYPSATYRTRLDTEFQKFGTRGISIIFASGDSGTGCLACAEFEPSFPATSIYVTSVGATRFLSGGTGGAEAAVEAFGSGGGMSYLFPIPSYQTSAVNTYFQTENDLPESFYYKRQGRGTPDVAALGIGFSVVVNGAVSSVGGTSCAAPTFSAVVSLLNDQRLNNNKKTLGFLNPFLYGTAFPKGAFFDVTVGDNQDGCCGYTGFRCNKGWDPVSGIGTPNFEVLSKLVKDLP